MKGWGLSRKENKYNLILNRKDEDYFLGDEAMTHGKFGWIYGNNLKSREI